MAGALNASKVIVFWPKFKKSYSMKPEIFDVKRYSSPPPAVHPLRVTLASPIKVIGSH
jgi:hypothetical protein